MAMEWKGCHSGLYTDVRVAMIHERSRQVEKFPNCRETTWPRTIPTPTFGLAFACPFPGFGHSDHLLPFPRLVESFAAVDLGAAEKVERPMGYGRRANHMPLPIAKERFTWGPTKWSNPIGQEV